ncbi:MAG: hypothetical protein ACREBW_03660 [Candidatus Micrarchaeaceae archaeon]
MFRRAKTSLAMLAPLAASLLVPLSAMAQPYLYSDVVVTPFECDSATPGGAFAAWVNVPGSRLYALEINVTSANDNAGAYLTHLFQYANGSAKNLSAESLQFTASDLSSTGTLSVEVQYQISGTNYVKTIPATVLKNKRRHEILYYDMKKAGIPQNAKLIEIYLRGSYNNGSFFGYFTNFYLNANPVLNKNFDTKPCPPELPIIT